MKPSKYVQYSSGSISAAASIPAKAPFFAQASLKHMLLKSDIKPLVDPMRALAYAGRIIVTTT